MNFKLPSSNVPLLVVADIIVYLGMNENATLNQICSFVGRSTSYIRSGIDVARVLGAIQAKGNSFVVNSDIKSYLGSTPSDETKIAVMRKLIQEWEPFILFIRYCLNGASTNEAARKIYVIYQFLGKDYKFLETLMISWGNLTKLITFSNDTVGLASELEESVGCGETVDLSDDLTIRLDIVERIGTKTFAFLQHDEVEELVEATKKSLVDSRSAIECAGRAFEDFLRRIAAKVLVDVSRANGIGQVVNLLYNFRSCNGVLENKIHSKHYSIGSALGDIRNMAGHGKEAKTMERWELTSFSAKSYVEMVLAIMQSIYVYIDNGEYIF